MAIKKPYIIFLLLLNASCMFLYKDEALTIDKEPYEGKELRLDGYYYLSSGNPDPWIQTYFLYEDGVFIKTSFNEEEVKLDESAVVSEEKEILLKKRKFHWGLFRVENNKIEIQGWTSLNGAYRLEKFYGKVLNDTT